jgi:hypothetical protein
VERGAVGVIGSPPRWVESENELSGCNEGSEQVVCEEESATEYRDFQALVTCMRPTVLRERVCHPRSVVIFPDCHVQYRHTPYPITDSDLASCVRLGLDLRCNPYGCLVDR